MARCYAFPAENPALFTSALTLDKHFHCRAKTVPTRNHGAIDTPAERPGYRAQIFYTIGLGA